ncbi:hypothetical protein Ddye_021974 [Dipteronia dyeriana]|uniref:SWIM-type domain-containing protein n=1 Tax=Dipteronia dyeriana TaxID=168575 RepID=A0AAD9U2P6_9ROSI|nr:hypothetical protein Ddye_021974 [Dipteronia dyeriana]
MDLFEFIRRIVMKKFQERKKECGAWNLVLPPMVNVKMLKNSKDDWLLTMIAAGDMVYEFLGPIEGYAVKMREYTCQCGSWKVSGIPCSHVMAVIIHFCGRATLKDKMTNFVHQNLT